MEGPESITSESTDRGMIPRAVEQIFITAADMQRSGWTFTIVASFLEIYNEQVKDLLCPEGESEKPKKYDIKHDSKGNTIISELTLVEVSAPKDVFPLLKKAHRARSTAATNCNERSSRSHSVFRLQICGSNAESGDSTNGVLNLVDLAGSERLSISGATGDRLKETQAINKSLSCLGDVICALANKDAHIPYRNSKLTYLLQPALGGDAKTLMFLNVSPVHGSLNETLCSLRFAAKVNSCEIGVARRNCRVDLKS
eukprot:CAMPEP_0196662440 /NCGR_PEP_ID=MMETSP1086-20130531/48716_1 /TAXON_ID=77921 /ORGANISM="Cyanoptyche  gloeocystis , Strain SAG4.97" /LENGTH=255 /DNA_ID=CAMNT_0041997825 /DNA_START=64 /DNA_END=831 /DNA_ORIENTATION=+